MDIATYAFTKTDIATIFEVPHYSLEGSNRLTNALATCTFTSIAPFRYTLDGTPLSLSITEIHAKGQPDDRVVLSISQADDATPPLPLVMHTLLGIVQALRQHCDLRLVATAYNTSHPVYATIYVMGAKVLPYIGESAE